MTKIIRDKCIFCPVGPQRRAMPGSNICRVCYNALEAWREGHLHGGLSDALDSLHAVRAPLVALYTKRFEKMKAAGKFFTLFEEPPL